jgi:hypothetical protein
MNYELEDSNYKNLNHVKMNCDNRLSKHDIKEPFANQSFFLMIVGKPGSGKSTFLLSMLTSTKKDRIYKGVFKDIIYCCPPNSRGTVKDNPLEECTVHNGISLDIVENIVDNKTKYDESPKKHYNQLLIIDDCTASLKNKQNIEILNELSMNRRHLSLSIILLTQYVTSVPASVRSQLSQIVLFKPSNNKDYDTLKREFINMHGDAFIDFINFVFKGAHDNLFIDCNSNEMYKNLQKIIFH